MSAFGRDDFQQQFVAAALHRLVERAHLCFLFEAVFHRVVGMIEDQALNDVFLRPGQDRRADGAAFLEHERVRPRQFHWTADPPAATGGGVERILSVAAIAKDADLAC